MNDNKKRAAAIAAVMCYLQEEAAAAQAASGDTAGRHRRPRDPGVWAGAGRQGMMQMRNMMQLKAFHRFR